MTVKMAAAMAIAARVYRPYDVAFSRRCLKVAPMKRPRRGLPLKRKGRLVMRMMPVPMPPMNMQLTITLR